MMIEHIAIWVRDLEKSKLFYTTFFGANPGDMYHNPTKEFSSYFLSFDSGSRLELMHKPRINSSVKKETLGITHFAISVGSKQKVDQLTQLIRLAGFEVHSEPRTTGDGYYESVILDPEGNRIEITT